MRCGDGWVLTCVRRFGLSEWGRSQLRVISPRNYLV